MTDGDPLARLVSVEGESSIGLPEPLAQLYDDLAPELHRFVLGVVRESDLADDVMQAAMIKAIEHGHEVRPETSRGWLFQVAFREALVARRRIAAQDRGQRRLAGIRLDRDQTPEDLLIRGETIDAVRHALQRIPDEQRAVILARIYEDKTFAEIARETGLPLGTVLTRMRRGLDKMRNFLKPGG